MVSIILNQSFILVALESQIKEEVGINSFEDGDTKWVHVKQKPQLSFCFPKEAKQIAKPSIQSAIPVSVSCITLNRTMYLCIMHLVWKQRQLINSACLKKQVIIIIIIIIVIVIEYLQSYYLDTIIIYRCMYRFLKKTEF